MNGNLMTILEKSLIRKWSDMEEIEMIQKSFPEIIRASR